MLYVTGMMLIELNPTRAGRTVSYDESIFIMGVVYIPTLYCEYAM